MSDTKKENLFAKLAAQQMKPAEAAVAVETPLAEPPSPALPEPARTKPSPKKKPEPPKGKRDHPDYCQANAYVPKKLRKAVDKVLLDHDELDYSTLIEDLLRKWLKSQGVSA